MPGQIVTMPECGGLSLLTWDRQMGEAADGGDTSATAGRARATPWCRVTQINK